MPFTPKNWVSEANPLGPPTSESDPQLSGPGIKDIEERIVARSVRAATTANITISTALNNGDVLDGVTLATGDRVLVKNQTTKKENGIWVVGASPTRATDSDTVGELWSGITVYVEEGTRNKRRVFTIITAGSITPGTTEHEWAQLYTRDFGLVEVLPSSEAVKGDRCTYIADKTNGVFWELVYDGEGEYPWKKIGGPGLYASSDVERARNNTAYGALPTDPLSITAPLKGDYDITIEANIWNENIGGRTGYLSYAIGAVAASDNWADRIYSGAVGGNVVGASKKTRQLGVVAAASIAEQARTTEGSCVFFCRRLTVDPVRVG